MNRRLTRRSLARLLAAAPVGLSLPAAAKRPAGPSWTEAQKKAIAKGAAELKKATGELHKMEIPIGTEPAFVFSPLVRKK